MIWQKVLKQNKLNHIYITKEFFQTKWLVTREKKGTLRKLNKAKKKKKHNKSTWSTQTQFRLHLRNYCKYFTLWRKRKSFHIHMGLQIFARSQPWPWGNLSTPKRIISLALAREPHYYDQILKMNSKKKFTSLKSDVN